MPPCSDAFCSHAITGRLQNEHWGWNLGLRQLCPEICILSSTLSVSQKQWEIRAWTKCFASKCTLNDASHYLARVWAVHCTRDIPVDKGREFDWQVHTKLPQNISLKNKSKDMHTKPERERGLCDFCKPFFSGRGHCTPHTSEHQA